jgi:hypothetical protein
MIKTNRNHLFRGILKAVLKMGTEANGIARLIRIVIL